MFQIFDLSPWPTNLRMGPQIQKALYLASLQKAGGIDVLQTLYCSLLPLFRESLTPELGL